MSRDTAQVDAAFKVAEEAHGPVEVLVADAGINRDQLLALIVGEDDSTDVLDTNLTGAYRVAKRAVARHDPAAAWPDHPDLVGRGPARLGRAG